MKQARRKELKTNELSLWLQQTYESLQRNGNYILIGAAVVVGILAIALFWRQRNHTRMQEAWASYYDLRSKDVTVQPEILDLVKGLSDREASNSQLGPLVLQLRAEMTYDLANSLVDPKEQTRRLELLQQARTTYKELIARYPDRQDVQNRAHFALAPTDESLATIGRDTLSPAETSELQTEAKQAYQYLLDHAPNTFSELARQQLASLDDRLRPVTIVATRPAEAVSTQPTITLGPGSDTARLQLGGKTPITIRPATPPAAPAAGVPAPTTIPAK